jgi:hypothetical protein
MENTNVNDLIKSIESNELGGSIYSREDVTRILRMVEVKQTSSLNIDYIVQDLRNVKEIIEDIEPDVDSAEFSLAGNEIMLDCCDVNSSQAIDEINDIVYKLTNGVYNKS